MATPPVRLISYQQEGEPPRQAAIVRTEPARKAAAGLARTIANLRAAGNKQGVARLRQKHVYTDPLKPEVEARTADLPAGTGLIFPRLQQADSRYLHERVHPERFEEQPRFSYSLQLAG